MTSNIVFECDNCGKNISETNHLAEYRLAVVSERMITKVESGPMLDPVPMPTSKTLHFCGWSCCHAWIETEALEDTN